MSKETLKVVEGGMVGAALGVAAGLYLASDDGKKLRKDMGKATAEFYKYLAPHIKKLKKVGGKEYKTAVKTAAKNYAKAKKLTQAQAKDLADRAEKSWKQLAG